MVLQYFSKVPMQLILLVFVIIGLANGLYGGSSEVIELTDANFKNRVLASEEIWVVEFFAPWCGHCKSLAPEYMKAAKALTGIVKVGAVDMTQHQSVGAPYNVQGFPTIKIFGANKQKAIDYNGARTAQSIVDAALNEIKKAVSARLGGKSSSGGGESKKGSAKDVIELTDSNFEDLVLHSKDMWIVEFFAPWCGHCKNLKPHWEKAATELKGKVKVGALDATTNQATASRFGIKGFPTIKYFAPGSGENDAVDYEGGRTGSDIVQWALDKVSENLPPPEVIEAVSHEVVEDACKEKQLCIFAVLPDILDCQSKCRNNYIQVLKDLADKFRKNAWGWLWTEAGKQTEMEEAFGMGGFGYPAMAAVNFRKAKYSMLKGSFGKDGIYEFLRDLSYGKGHTVPIKGADFPKVRKVEPWDGKDGVMPVEEDIDLSDVELDDMVPPKKSEL